MSVYGTQVGEHAPEWRAATARYDIESLVQSALEAGDELRKITDAMPDFSADGHKAHPFKGLYSERMRAARERVQRLIEQLTDIRGAAEREVARCESNARRLEQGHSSVSTGPVSTHVREAQIAQDSELRHALAQREQVVSITAWLRGLLQRSHRPGNAK